MTTKLEKWHIFDEKTTPVQILDERSLFVADARPEHARLIAAAPALLAELREAEPLLAALCSVALRKEVQDFLPHGLLIQVDTWLKHNDAQGAIRAAVGAQEENTQQEADGGEFLGLAISFVPTQKEKP